MNQLWLKDGRLVKGSDPIAAKPYQDHDYMVLEIERRDSRDDWPSLPGIAEFQDEFGAIMANGTLTASERKKQLGELWPSFQQGLASSKYLTTPDRENIAHSVSEDLTKRLAALQDNNPFIETRSWTDMKSHAISPTQFDFVDVPAYTDRGDLESVKRAQVALAGNPFR